MDADVLVVGAGPTGLMLASWLVRCGVRVVVIDGKAGPTPETRALAVQARTLEVYDQLGLTARALQEGTEAGAITVWANRRIVGSADFHAMGKGQSPHPGFFVLGQDRNERLLLDFLEEQGGRVRWLTELVGLRQDEAGVTATVREADGHESCLRARYACGCDGASSSTRHALAVPFPGGTYAHRFFVADVRAHGALRSGAVNLCFNAERFEIFFPMPGPGRFRIVGIVPPALAERAHLTYEDVRADVERQFDVGVEETYWFSTYRVHHRVADSFRRGRVFLLGDAAHIHSPVGGQGMNTGLMDAANLAWKLAMVVKGEAGSRLLASYAPERMPFARRLVHTTDRLFTWITREGRTAAFLRAWGLPAVFAVLSRLGPARRLAFRFVSQTAVSYRGGPLARGRAGKVRAGDRLPWVPAPDGSDNFAALQALKPCLQTYGGDAKAFAALAARYPAFGAEARPFTAEARRAGLREGALYLVRPDGHVGFAAPGLDAEALASYLHDTWGWRALGAVPAGSR